LLEDEDFSPDLKRQETSVERYLDACERKQREENRKSRMAGDIWTAEQTKRQLISFGMVLLGGVVLGLILVRWLPLLAWLISPFFLFCWGFWILEVAGNRAFREICSEALGLVPDSETDVAKATLALFDLVYTIPLRLMPHGRDRRQKLDRADWTPFKAWWALTSSGVIALIITVILTYFVFPSYRDGGHIIDGVHTAFFSGIAVNIISDYLAVLVIRRWLVAGAGLPPDLIGQVPGLPPNLTGQASGGSSPVTADLSQGLLIALFVLIAYFLVIIGALLLPETGGKELDTAAEDAPDAPPQAPPTPLRNAPAPRGSP
jgi:hypothetical protein